MSGTRVALRRERHGDFLRESLKDLAQVFLNFDAFVMYIPLLHAPLRTRPTGM